MIDAKVSVCRLMCELERSVLCAVSRRAVSLFPITNVVNFGKTGEKMYLMAASLTLVFDLIMIGPLPPF